MTTCLCYILKKTQITLLHRHNPIKRSLVLSWLHMSTVTLEGVLTSQNPGWNELPVKHKLTLQQWNFNFGQKPYYNESETFWFIYLFAFTVCQSLRFTIETSSRCSPASSYRSLSSSTSSFLLFSVNTHQSYQQRVMPRHYTVTLCRAYQTVTL